MGRSPVALVFALLLAMPAQAAGCGEKVRLSVEPPEKADAVAAVLKRRLVAAGAAPLVEAEGAGVGAVLPEGAAETLFTRPARIEFHIVAKSDDAPGAVSLARAQGGRESVEPQVILDERNLREFSVRENDGHAAIAFRFDPHAMKNLLSATADAVGAKLAIVVDDVVVADPIIRAPVASANGEIDAGLTLASAKEMVGLLANGRLPARVAVVGREPAACPTP